jgi:hypothetical protein
MAILFNTSSSGDNTFFGIKWPFFGIKHPFLCKKRESIPKI